MNTQAVQHATQGWLALLRNDPFLKYRSSLPGVEPQVGMLPGEVERESASLDPHALDHRLGIEWNGDPAVRL